MRSKLHAPQLRALSQVSTILAFGVFLTACSNDAMRFNDVLTTSTAMTPNQHSIMHGKAKTQPYPEDLVKSGATSNGIRISKPALSVTKPAPLAPKVASSALPAVKPSLVVPKIYQPPTAPTITPKAPKALSNGAMVLKPRKSGPVNLALSGTDSLSTGSISNPVERKGGWGSAGGSYVTARSGETLYNLSRRFGVPVEAIQRANGMNDASTLTAGSRILIPAYTYSAKTGVSAPDSHPVTKAVRASKGFQGQVTGRVATPKVRDTRTVSAPIVSKQPVLSGSSYKVVSGDTLYGISRKLGVSASALRSANGISGSNIRLGQILRVPNGSSNYKSVANQDVQPIAIDPVRTSSVPKKQRSGAVKSAAKVQSESASIQQRSAEKVSTPKQTSAGAFRWPIRGRVIRQFGERQASGVNDGIDISVPEGTPIKAAETGTVIYSGSELADFGNLILVSHSGGWVSAYAHASSNNVKRGDKVSRGQVIAMSGRSGNATVPKLHFELRKNSTPVNPLKHLSK